jgi:hypothetical protein
MDQRVQRDPIFVKGYQGIWGGFSLRDTGRASRSYHYRHTQHPHVGHAVGRETG